MLRWYPKIIFAANPRDTTTREIVRLCSGLFGSSFAHFFLWLLCQEFYKRREKDLRLFLVYLALTLSISIIKSTRQSPEAVRSPCSSSPLIVGHKFHLLKARKEKLLSFSACVDAFRSFSRRASFHRHHDEAKHNFKIYLIFHCRSWWFRCFFSLPVIFISRSYRCFCFCCL